jgi:nucleoside-diphosphate-sugar epimerase
MRIAILGATSHIAKDLIRLFIANPKVELSLYARRTQQLDDWLAQQRAPSACRAKTYAEFENSPPGTFDAVLNFVGSGNPALTASLGREIWDVTRQFDELALGYVLRHPECRYIFLSSGAAFGSDFSLPVSESTVASVHPNNVASSDWYGLAKLSAEISHRRFNDLGIVDVRVFSYFSHTVDPSARFLITDILRAIKTGQVFETSAENITRDYLSPHDLYQMICKILQSASTNVAVDCYTKMPVEKIQMLEALKAAVGLSYRLIDADAGINATGAKKNYYSTNHLAHTIFAYSPALSSLETIVSQSEIFLS